MTTLPTLPASNVPSKIFETFLQALAKEGIAEDTISRLRKTLLENPDLSERALKNAFSPEETLP